MSRGYGRIQRELLTLVSESPMTLTGAACAIFRNQTPSRSQYEAVRRAFSKLQEHEVFARRGTVARSHVWTAGGLTKLEIGQSDHAAARKKQLEDRML